MPSGFLVLYLDLEVIRACNDALLYLEMGLRVFFSLLAFLKSSKTNPVPISSQGVTRTPVLSSDKLKFLLARLVLFGFTCSLLSRMIVMALVQT